MSARESLRRNESWWSARTPVFYLLSISLDFIPMLGKLGSNETFYFAKTERFSLGLSIRIISISKVGCDLEMKIQSIPSPKAKVRCFDRIFFLPLGPFCLKSIYSFSKLYI